MAIKPVKGILKALSESIESGKYSKKKEQSPTVVRAYRGGSGRIWTPEGEMSVEGGKIKTDQSGAFLSSNPSTASSYAKLGKPDSQVAPVEVETKDFIKVDPPEGTDYSEWYKLSPDSVVTLTDGSKYTLGEMIPEYKHFNQALSTDFVSMLMRKSPFFEGKGVMFNKVQDRGPHLWGSTKEEQKEFGAKAFEPQTTYVAWDESVMKGSHAKNEAPGYMNSALVGSGAMGGLSPEEQLFASNEPEMSAMPEGGIREALYSVGDVLKSRERNDITSTQELGDVFNKLGRGEKLGLMDYLESTAVTDPTSYPAILDALKEYLRKNGDN
jgi:hypothetical protein